MVDYDSYLDIIKNYPNLDKTGDVLKLLTIIPKDAAILRVDDNSLDSTGIGANK